VQRGNNRQPCFEVPGDRDIYLGLLGKAAARSGCAVHGYVLMTNHVHILATPGCAGAVAAMMQVIGSRYVTYFNRRHGRTGTLWEGRYRSCVVDTGAYFLHCLRYIELNPVRAGMCGRAEDYVWSSHRANAFGVHNGLIRPHPSYERLGLDPASRCRAFAAIVAMATPASELADIRRQTRKGGALGDEAFRRRIAELKGLYSPVREAGRPRAPA
jgi:putative transposase